MSDYVPLRVSPPAPDGDPEANGRVIMLDTALRDSGAVYPWCEWHPESARLNDPEAWGEQDMDVVSLCLPADEAASFARACEIIADLIELCDVADESPLLNLPGYGRIVGRLAAHVLALRAENDQDRLRR